MSLSDIDEAPHVVCTVSTPQRLVWTAPPATPTIKKGVLSVSTPQRLVWNATLVDDNMANFTIRQGDTGRPLAVLLKNQDGSDTPMPVGTSCQFTMVHRQTGHTVTGVATLSDGPNSANNNQANYAFSNPADTSQPGLYDAAWVVTYPGGGTETFPTRSRGPTGYTVEVTQDLGNVGLSGS